MNHNLNTAEADPGRKGRVVSGLISGGLFSAALGCLYLALHLAEAWPEAPGWVLVHLFLLMMAALLGVFATAFSLFARKSPALFHRAHAFAKRLPERPAATNSLLNEVISTTGTGLLVVLVTLTIYWITSYFTFNGHVVSVSIGLAVLVGLTIRGSKDRPVLEKLARCTAILVVFGGVSLSMLFSARETQSVLRVTAEIIAWLAPATLFVLHVLARFKRPPVPREKERKSAFSSVYLFWWVSEIVLKATRRDHQGNIAIAIILTFLVFVVPDQVIAFTPDDLASMFREVWSTFGELPIGKEDLPYVALAIYVMLIATDTALHIPDVLPESWLLIGGLYNAILKAMIGISYILLIIPVFSMLFFVGQWLLGQDLAVVVGFFTFPTWTQRVFALATSAFVLTFDVEA